MPLLAERLSIEGTLGLIILRLANLNDCRSVGLGLLRVTAINAFGLLLTVFSESNVWVITSVPITSSGRVATIVWLIDHKARLNSAGRNVVDLRSVLVDRLEERLDRLEDTHREVLAAAYENVAGTNQVHRACLALLEAEDFAGFLKALTHDVAITRLSGSSVARTRAQNSQML